MNIALHFQKTPWGPIVVGFFEEKICHISFATTRNAAEQNVHEDFPKALLVWNQRPDLDLTKLLTDSQNLVLYGTPFQIAVWTALQHIPLGQTISYSTLAARLHKPSATRAVASAVARNKIALAIPCHRVIRANGSHHQYRWGAQMKTALLQWEEMQKTLLKPAQIPLDLAHKAQSPVKTSAA